MASCFTEQSSARWATEDSPGSVVRPPGGAHPLGRRCTSSGPDEAIGAGVHEPARAGSADGPIPSRRSGVAPVSADPADPLSPLQVTRRANPRLVVLVDAATGRATVAGRLAGDTIPALHEAVSALLRSGPASWSVDVTQLVVADDAGLRAIAGAYRRALRHGHRLTLHGASPQLQSALVRLRLASHLLAD
jgi:anti-anti-sigma regulatory factor